MDEGLKTFVQFIVDYGVMVLISAIFLYIVIRVVNIFLKHLENRLDKSKEEKTEKDAHEEHDKLINMRTEIGMKIQSIIEEYLVACGGSRVHVIEFSNSIVSVAYLPFRYMTCTYEVYRFDKSATGHKIDRMSTSLFTPFFAELHNKPYCIFDINDKKTLVGGAMCDLMRAQNEHQALCVSMKSHKGKALGYVEMMKEEKFTEEDIKGIQDISAQISTLLSVVDI